MADIFKPSDWSVQQLVDAVAAGSLRLPDLQRPFVWPKTKVRDLLDSMYRGYPVGELMFWNRVGDEETGAIGGTDKQQTSTHQIVDGQQRVTSLYVVLTGQKVVDDDYVLREIRISFNPFTERFEVAQPALDRSADWVPDVADIFRSSLKAHNTFVKRLQEARQAVLPEEDLQRIHDALTRLDTLRHRTFKVVELLPSVDKSVVADVFVRINSEGVNLTSSDFILTWLSVFWPEGREQIETFARHSRLSADRISEMTGTKTSWTPKNHYLAPDPGQLVRVAVAVGQGRGRLQDAYSALRALDRKSGVVDPSKQATELDKIKTSVPLMLKELNWDEFIRVMATAGFRSKKMVTSDTVILYTYVLWLLGRTKYNVDVTLLRNLMARWFFMSQTTRRYSGSYESRIQQDLDRLDEATSAEDFVGTLDGVIKTVLTPDLWSIRLPEDLISSSTSASPAYQAYLAALNILDADLFMLTGKFRDWTDPTATSIKNVEGHHLFPKAYLRDKLGYTDLKRINQIANFAPTDWATNNLISDRPPHDYWPELLKDRNLSGKALSQQMFWHAIPENWTELGYEEFLESRRRLMAEIIHAGYQRLLDPTYEVELPAASQVIEDAVHALTLTDLVNAGRLRQGDILAPIDPDNLALAEISEDGEMLLDDKAYDSPLRAARAVGDENIDGWDFWALPTDDGAITLRELADGLTPGAS